MPFDLVSGPSMSWIDQSFDEHTVAWLLLTSVIGGVVGAAITFVLDFSEFVAGEGGVR